MREQRFIKMSHNKYNNLFPVPFLFLFFIFFLVFFISFNIFLLNHQYEEKKIVINKYNNYFDEVVYKNIFNKNALDLKDLSA